MAAIQEMQENFALHHLFAACRFAAAAGQVERENAGRPLGAFWEEILHNSLGVAALTVIFLDSYANDLSQEGSVLAPRRESAAPAAREAEAADSIVRKFAAAVAARGGRPLDYQADVVRNVDTLIKLRNEVVRRRSLRKETGGKKDSLSEVLEKCIPTSVFFPHEPMLPRAWASYDFAVWALRSTVAFLEYVYAQAGLQSPLEKHRVRLTELCGQVI